MNKVAAVIPHLWRAVGNQLGISFAKLEAINMQHIGNPMECFREVFYYWSNNPTICMAYSWESIVEVLQSPEVGQIELARHIKNTCGV